METQEGVEPPFADLQSAAKSTIDNWAKNCRWYVPRGDSFVTYPTRVWPAVQFRYATTHRASHHYRDRQNGPPGEIRTHTVMHLKHVYLPIVVQEDKW